MTIQDILQQKREQPVLVRPTETVLSIVRLMREKHVSAVIVEDDHLQPASIFTERDLGKAIAKHGAGALSMAVGPLSSAPLVTCSPSERLEVALATMTLANVRHLVVLDGTALAGVVSIVDLVRQRLQDKEFEARVLLDLSRLHS